MKNRNKGFTLIELLIVIMVMGILAVMMLLSAQEFVASAKASNIMSNLVTLKKATIAWYMDNMENIVTVKTEDRVPGMVLINGKPKPIQECKDSEIHISRYLSHLGKTSINLNIKETVTTNSGNQINTNLTKGCYGICDGGGKAGKRHEWYVGYRFKDGEEAVRTKVIGRSKSIGLFMGTADAHPDADGDNAAAVWLRVI